MSERIWYPPEPRPAPPNERCDEYLGMEWFGPKRGPGDPYYCLRPKGHEGPHSGWQGWLGRVGA